MGSGRLGVGRSAVQGRQFTDAHGRPLDELAIIVPLGILYGALVAWRGNLRASTIAHSLSDIFEGWLKFL
jgi:hypothetical protein